jgi:malate dehydrogenase (oxaloacetate-decarboxylating)(NADP+)
VIYQGRTEGMDQWKSAHAAVDTAARTLEERWKGADVFLGLSAKGAVKPDMVKDMAPKPIIFAMANPDPEITPPMPRPRARCDRRDRPFGLSQPGQQRAGLPLHLPRRARCARDRDQRGNEDRRRQCHRRTGARAGARGSRRAYGKRHSFGPDYIIPAPFDPRLMEVVPRRRQGGDGFGVAQSRSRIWTPIARP